VIRRRSLGRRFVRQARVPQAIQLLRRSFNPRAQPAGRLDFSRPGELANGRAAVCRRHLVRRSISASKISFCSAAVFPSRPAARGHPQDRNPGIRHQPLGKNTRHLRVAASCCRSHQRTGYKLRAGNRRSECGWKSLASTFVRRREITQYELANYGGPAQDAGGASKRICCAWPSAKSRVGADVRRA